MKQYGLLGKGSGKLGSAVFAVNGGEQIVREYNPKVSNPNTAAQIEQRAKLKLLSQLAADLAPGLFFKKKGLVSARNQFIAANMSLCQYDNEEASVTIYSLQLSPSTSPLPEVQADKVQGGYKCFLGEDPVSPLESVYYIGVRERETGYGDSRLSLVGIVHVTEKGPQGNFEHLCPWERIDYIFAVGVKEVDGSKKTFYDNYNAGDATSLATLGVFLNSKDFTSVITQSRGNIANNGE